jgi:hypothetical protein
LICACQSAVNKDKSSHHQGSTCDEYLNNFL